MNNKTDPLSAPLGCLTPCNMYPTRQGPSFQLCAQLPNQYSCGPSGRLCATQAVPSGLLRVAPLQHLQGLCNDSLELLLRLRTSRCGVGVVLCHVDGTWGQVL